MKLTCVVDNTVRLSAPLWGEHGLAMLIETAHGQVLFDTGASGTVLQHNMALLHKRLAAIDALVLSHGHYDHTGGLAVVLEARPGLRVHAHPGVLRGRYTYRDNEYHPIGMPMEEVRLRTLSDLRLDNEYREIVPGVWTSGQITNRNEPEGRGKTHMVRDGEAWIADPYEDDQSLVLRGASGLTLVCGCCHAGLMNTIEHVHRVFGDYPRVIIGGTHLASADDVYLQVIARQLESIGSPALYPGHCTGQKAYAALAALLGGRVSSLAAGVEIELS